MFTTKILEILGNHKTQSRRQQWSKYWFAEKELKPMTDPDPIMTDHDLLALAVQKINELKEKVRKLEGEQ